jgi:TonB family protein
MLRTTILAVAIVTTLVQRFEPARVTSAQVGEIPYRTAAAAVVGVEVTVDSRGLVTNVRDLVAVEPFTDVLRSSATRWTFDAARGGGQRVESHILVAGVFRPAMLMFPRPDVPKSVDAQPSDDIPFPTSLEVPNYPPNAIGSAYVLVEVEVGESGSVSSAKTIGETTGFDSAALQAARAWTFRPASRDGRPVSAFAYLVFAFRQPA